MAMDALQPLDTHSPDDDGDEGGSEVPKKSDALPLSLSEQTVEDAREFLQLGVSNPLIQLAFAEQVINVVLFNFRFFFLLDICRDETDWLASCIICARDIAIAIGVGPNTMTNRISMATVQARRKKLTTREDAWCF